MATAIPPTPTKQEPLPLNSEATGGANLWRTGTLTYTSVGLRHLFFWLLWGDFTLALRERSVSPTFQYLLTDLGASDFVLSFLIGFIPHAIAMVLQPVVSYRSDRHRGPHGRRIPFLLITTPFCFLGMIGIAFSPRIGSWAHPILSQTYGWFVGLIQWLPAGVPLVHQLDGSAMSLNGSILTSVAICWTMFEIAAIASGPVFNGLINDVVPRNVIGRFYGLFRVISLADGIFFMLVLIKYARTHFVEIFCGIGALFAISFTLMCFKVKEGEYPPPDQAPDGKPRGFIKAARIYFRECFSHPYYRWIATSVALAAMAFIPINLFSIKYSNSLKIEPKVYGYFSAIQFAFSLVQAYPIGWLCDRFHPIKLVITSFFLHGTTMLLAFFLVQGPISFGVFHVLGGSFAGFWLTASSPMLPALLPKVRFATFTSGIALISSIGTMVLSLVCGWFFDWIDHQYRYIFFWALALDMLALGATLVVYGRFISYGGQRNYVAPE